MITKENDRTNAVAHADLVAPTVSLDETVR
jgi:hypothetical protein